jgi:hypothetical protein
MQYYTFLKHFAKIHPHLSYDQLRKKAKAPYKKWKKHHQMRGGSINESIGDFLWNNVVKPIGKMFYEGYQRKGSERARR